MSFNFLFPRLLFAWKSSADGSDEVTTGSYCGLWHSRYHYVRRPATCDLRLSAADVKLLYDVHADGKFVELVGLPGACRNPASFRNPIIYNGGTWIPFIML